MTSGLKDRAMTHIGPRIPEFSRDRMGQLWPTANRGAEWLLASFPNLYDRTLAEMRGYFTKEELSLIVDAADLTVLLPEMAGQILLFFLQDKMALPTLEANYPTVDIDQLAEKVGKLRHYQRAMLEIWAQAYRQEAGNMSRGEYLAALT
jgi:hypothetical protein